jgi:hypothetical protein
MKFCTLTRKICEYYPLALHRAATTAAQMAAPVPEIMDTFSYAMLYLTVCRHTTD